MTKYSKRHRRRKCLCDWISYKKFCKAKFYHFHVFVLFVKVLHMVSLLHVFRPRFGNISLFSHAWFMDPPISPAFVSECKLCKPHYAAFLQPAVPGTRWHISDFSRHWSSVQWKAGRVHHTETLFLRAKEDSEINTGNCRCKYKVWKSVVFVSLKASYSCSLVLKCNTNILLLLLLL